MAKVVSEEGDNLIIKSTLIIDKNNGIIGTDYDYEIESADQRSVAICLVVPKAFFEPVKIKIELPQELMPITTGLPEVVSVPIEIVPKEVNTVIQEVVTADQKNSILGFIRKKILG